MQTLCRSILDVSDKWRGWQVAGLAEVSRGRSIVKFDTPHEPAAKYRRSFRDSRDSHRPPTIQADHFTALPKVGEKARFYIPWFVGFSFHSLFSSVFSVVCFRLPCFNPLRCAFARLPYLCEPGKIA
jgi:hypothetical protein